MRFRLWPRREPVEPSPPEESVTPAPPTESPAVSELERRTPEPEAQEPVEAEAEAEADRVPSSLTLTIDEAKAMIKEAGGDVIQVGFLASAYRRQREEDPASAETAAARTRLTDLVAKRLKDRGLLAADGSVALRDEAAS